MGSKGDHDLWQIDDVIWVLRSVTGDLDWVQEFAFTEKNSRIVKGCCHAQCMLSCPSVFEDCILEMNLCRVLCLPEQACRDDCQCHPFEDLHGRAAHMSEPKPAAGHLCRRVAAVWWAFHHPPWSGGGAGVTDLKDWHEWPKWQPQDLQARFPALEAAGVDLMRQMFVYDPAKRITVIRLPPLSTGLPSSLDSIILSASCTRQTRDDSVAATSASSHARVACCCGRGFAASRLLTPPGVRCFCDAATFSSRCAAMRCVRAVSELCAAQAKDALAHPYFDDLDKAAIDLLENESLSTPLPGPCPPDPPLLCAAASCLRYCFWEREFHSSLLDCRSSAASCCSSRPKKNY